MMHGHEKSDLAIVAMKPANKVALRCGTVRREVSRSGVGGAKGEGQGKYAPAKHVLDSEPGSRGKRWRVYGYLCRHTPKAGAVCGKAARTDLGGGRAVKRTSLPLLCCARILLHVLTTALGTTWTLADPAARPLSARADIRAPDGDFRR